MTCGRTTSEATLPGIPCVPQGPLSSSCQCARIGVGEVGKSDPVNHPAHYTAGRVECIDAIESAVTGLEGVEAGLVWQIIKYVWRYARKNGTEDLRKAKWYLERLIERSLIVKAQKIGPDYEVSE